MKISEIKNALKRAPLCTCVIRLYITALLLGVSYSFNNLNNYNPFISPKKICNNGWLY